MLYCGITYNSWVETAFKYLPDEIVKKINGKIAITVLKSDACRLAQKICNHEEIIILSPWIFTFIPPGASETDKECKYLIFSILHEVAHAVQKHTPPDEISPQEDKDQEDEADRYALKWFNDYALKHNERGITPIAIDEIRELQKNYHEKVGSMLNGG